MIERDGFVVIPDFVDVAACEELRERALELVAAWEPPERGSVFSTTDQDTTTDARFLASGSGIDFFYEEDGVSSGAPKELALNKIGHAMHDIDPVFSAFSRSPRLAALSAELGFVEPLLLQSMYIFKQPHIGGEVVAHTDATFLSTEPVTVTGLWFALEDATIENGCLWALPGGHRRPLHRRWIRDGDTTHFDELGPPPPEDGYVPLEAAAGTLVVLHGLLPHRSGPNRSDRSRHAYSLHIIDGTARYLDGNWIRRPVELPLRGF
jgi:phytanoyl-CoA hydroxylase